MLLVNFLEMSKMIKRVANCFYAHKSNLSELQKKLTKSMNEALESFINKADKLKFNFAVVKIDINAMSITLIECENWDVANEPDIGWCYRYKILDNSYTMQKPRGQIYHSRSGKAHV